ncbi:MAG: LysM peptidoglycan-binding domain-containing protein [Burkholderiaceae bacterium]|nr:LysM peptidoglycan-binding domain-containing protein [Burkholderiaceae bacterium]
MSSCPPRLARSALPVRTRRSSVGHAAIAPWLLASALLLAGPAQAVEPVTAGQRATAAQVAQTGVPLSALADNAPAAHTVQRGDTLWAISGLFLKSPWRWPELWGMNLQDIRNPHLIYPGQVLLLVKDGDRARLQLAGAGAAGQPPTNTVKLSPRVRSQVLESGAIAAVPMQLIAPFLNEAVVLSQDQLAAAPRIVAAPEGRVLISRGETAYVRGDLGGARSFTLFRQSKPLTDPSNNELLGYEASFIGTAEFVRAEGTSADSGLPVPSTFVLTSIRMEAGVGDRLAPVPKRDFDAFLPHAPDKPVDGRVVSIYGEALSAGQNQIVAINRGARDGIERGHVLALWSAGVQRVDDTDGQRQPIQLPDERTGLLFVFRVFERVSYGLILSAGDPIRPGDRFSQP